MPLSIAALFALASILLMSAAAADDLPTRQSPIPQTTDIVPHVQIGVEPIAEISAELLQRVDQLPGVDIRNTVVSLPGALGFWISEDVALARPEAIVRGREFAHLHPDGSLHASMSPDEADEAVAAGWAVHHPWADERAGWEGFVMIFTPTSMDELDVVSELVSMSYEYVTGNSVRTEE